MVTEMSYGLKLGNAPLQRCNGYIPFFSAPGYDTILTPVLDDQEASGKHKCEKN